MTRHHQVAKEDSICLLSVAKEATLNEQWIKPCVPLWVLCWLIYPSWFQGPKYIAPSFWPRVTNHDVKSKISKKWFLRSLLFYTTFSWCWNVEEETKNICEGHTKILVCTTCGLRILKTSQELWKAALRVGLLSRC